VSGELLSVAGRLASLWWLTGPIFEKELRVASRRKRNYALRFFYIAALTCFVGFAWFATAGRPAGGSLLLQVSRTPMAGLYATSTIIWFQFIAAQVIASVMLSTAISDEIYRRTLGVLMTTPITAVQIVMGKLCSRMLQLVLLLAASLPLLLVVRMLGGVPWQRVFAAVAVTLTAALFVGAVSLFFSIYRNKAPNVVSATVLVCLGLYLGLPVLNQAVNQWQGKPLVSNTLLGCLNPFVMMGSITAVPGRWGTTGASARWPVHCAVMLGLSACWLGLSALGVRRAAIRQIGGFGFRKKVAGRRSSAGGKVRPVVGPPIIWKALNAPLFEGHWLRGIISTTIGLGLLCTAYVVCGYNLVLANKETQAGFVAAFLLLLLVMTLMASAVSVTKEKEARTWPILLTTPMDHRRIVLEKIAAGCVQAWPMWLLLVGHLIVFTIVGYIHPFTIFPVVFLAAGAAALCSSVGVCFSCCCRRTSRASVLAMLAFWLFVMPVFTPCVTNFIVSPVTAAVLIMQVGGGRQAARTALSAMEYPLFGGGIGGLVLSMLVLCGLIVFYLLLAFAAFEIARANVRSKIF